MIDQFVEVREYVMSTIAQQVEVFLTGMWDPMMKFIIIRETVELMRKDVLHEFPDLPKEHVPQVKFKIFEDEHRIEVGVQNYFNSEKNLTFLGTNDIGSTPFDYYVRDSYDPRFDYIFMARFGHDRECLYTGSKTAEAEYYMGVITPLSVAYGMAIDDGFIS